MLARGAVWNPSIFATSKSASKSAGETATGAAGAASGGSAGELAGVVPAGAADVRHVGAADVRHVGAADVRHVALRPQHEMVQRYLQLAAACANHVNNSKYVAMQARQSRAISRDLPPISRPSRAISRRSPAHLARSRAISCPSLRDLARSRAISRAISRAQMIELHGKSRTFRQMQACRDHAEITPRSRRDHAEINRLMTQACRDHAGLLAAAADMANDEYFQTSTVRSVAALEPPPDLPAAPALPINAWRDIPVHCRDARAVRKRGLDECNSMQMRLGEHEGLDGAAGGDASAATSGGGVVLDWRG